MQWLQDPTQSIIENENNVRGEASRHTRNKTKEFLKAKIVEIETNIQIKNIRDLYKGIKNYHPTTNIVKDEKGDLLKDPHSILASWRNHFSQLLNVHGVNDIRQTEIHTAELPVRSEVPLSFWVGYWKAKK